jgi:hypothetical protein
MAIHNFGMSYANLSCLRKFAMDALGAVRA